CEMFLKPYNKVNRKVIEKVLIRHISDKLFKESSFVNIIIFIINVYNNFHLTFTQTNSSDNTKTRDFSNTVHIDDFSKTIHIDNALSGEDFNNIYNNVDFCRYSSMLDGKYDILNNDSNLINYHFFQNTNYN